jgi:hypothetical protein
MGHNECLIFCQITADEERRVSQQTWEEFYTDATHLKFFIKNLMARSYADAHFVCNFSGLGPSPTEILSSLKRVTLVALHSAHTVLPVCLVKQFKYLM